MQSHLLKLEPPYQIIACRGEIGVQIGTLIVMEETCGDDGKYGITSHSHPVVSYMDKSLTRNIFSKRNSEIDEYPEPIYSVAYGEGVVWDKVECNECITISFTDIPDRKISDLDFSDMVQDMLENIALEGKWQGLKLLEFASKLQDMGFTISDSPSTCHCTLRVSEGSSVDFGDKLVIDNSRRDFPMPVPVMEPEKMLGWYKKLIRQYQLIFGREKEFYFKSFYEPPYGDGLIADIRELGFDPEHLTPAQQACNDIVKLLNETDLKEGLQD